MKDSQTVLKAPSGSIPFVSTLLHVMAMPLLVLFRHGFGYLYLSPKKIFLSLVFAQSLFAYMVWHDPDLRGFGLLSVFGCFVSALYVAHLVTAVLRQQKETAEHDQFVGSSWLLLVASKAVQQKLGPVVHGIVEPLIGVIAGLFFFSTWLGPLLVASGVALALKELIGAWQALRTRKRMADNLVDVEDSIKLARPGDARPIIPKGRTAPERHARRYDGEATDRDRKAEEYAGELRLMPPYDLEQAEANFQRLSQDLDPDIPADSARLHRLKAALAFFRDL